MAYPNDNTPVEPVTLADIPRALQYVHPTQGTTIEVCGGIELDITRQTPYGALAETDAFDNLGDDIADAWQWALDNGMKPDPTKRQHQCGPRGTFDVRIGGNTRYSTADSTEHSTWRCTKTVVAKPSQKSSPSCRGAGQGNDENSLYQGHATRIWWDPQSGYEDLPCLLMQGSELELSRLCFTGQRHNAYTGRKTLGIGVARITSTGHPWYIDGTTTPLQPNAPTTGLFMHRCSTVGFDVAIQNGGQASDNNCDHHLVWDVKVTDCGKFWRNVNSQGMVSRFERIHGEVDDIFFDFQGGGKAVLSHIYPYSSGIKLLNIGADGSTIGKNNNSFLLLDCGFDSQWNGNSWLVYMEDRAASAAWGTVAVVTGSTAYNEATYTFPTRFVRLASSVNYSQFGYKHMGPIECAKSTDGNGTVYRPTVCVGPSNTFKYTTPPLDLAARESLIMSGDYELAEFDPRQEWGGGTDRLWPYAAPGGARTRTDAEVQSLAQAKINQSAANDAAIIAAAGRPRSY